MTDAQAFGITVKPDNPHSIQFAPPAHDGSWVATLSDGTTAVEYKGEWTVNPGERKPWVRLTHFLADNDLYLTSLRLNFRGRTIHLPRSKFEKFGMEGRAPEFYSLQYHLEVDDVMGGNPKGSIFVDMAAHYDNFAVHYIQDVVDGNDSWVVVTDGKNSLAPTPRKK